MTMFARISRFKGSPDREETALTGPPPAEIQAMAGFVGAYTLANRQTGDVMLITLWESEEAMAASAERAKRLRAEAVEELGGSGPAQVETYEVMSHP
jgi:heme-degrading monooxygenase HmoA